MRQKYGTPRAALAAMGFDAQTITDIINEAKSMPRFSYAYDQDPDDTDTQMTAEWCLGKVREMMDALSPDERTAFVDGLANIGDPLADAMDRGRRIGRDEPPPFPGRPRPGGTMDPIGVTQSSTKQAEDARRKMYDRQTANLLHAMDASPAARRADRAAHRGMAAAASWTPPNTVFSTRHDGRLRVQG